MLKGWAQSCGCRDHMLEGAKWGCLELSLHPARYVQHHITQCASPVITSSDPMPTVFAHRMSVSSRSPTCECDT